MSALLEDDFFVCSSDKGHSNFLCHLVLTHSTLKGFIEKRNSQKVALAVRISDIIGCGITDGKRAPAGRSEFQSSSSLSSVEIRSHSNPKVYLTLYAFTLSKNIRGIEYRKRVAITLSYSKHPSYEENECEVNRWRLCVLHLIREDVISLPNLEMLEPVKVPKLIIFVNPKSGTGNAVKTFKQRLAVLFDQACISYELIITTSAGHAMKHVMQLPDLNEYQGIVVVSGDGLLHEVYNGLFKRKDFEAAISFPVGIISQGSGNALARSLAHFNKEPYLFDPALVSALNVIKLRTVSSDLAIVTMADNSKVCSFLTFGWGLISDIDIESERLRSIGEARFTLWAFARVLRLRKYKAKLSYLPAPLAEDSGAPRAAPLPSLDQPVPDNWIVLNSSFVCVYGSLYPYISSDTMIAPQSKINDGRLWLIVVTSPVSKLQVSQLLLGMADGGHVKYPWVRCIPVTAFRLEPEETTGTAAFMTIDGERIPSQTIQVEVLKGAGKVFMR